MVIRFSSSEKNYEELDNNNNIWAAYSQNPTAFVSKLFSGKSNFQLSYYLLIKLNASHRKFDGIKHIILVL